QMVMTKPKNTVVRIASTPVRTGGWERWCRRRKARRRERAAARISTQPMMRLKSHIRSLLCPGVVQQDLHKILHASVGVGDGKRRCVSGGIKQQHGHETAGATVVEDGGTGVVEPGVFRQGRGQHMIRPDRHVLGSGP